MLSSRGTCVHVAEFCCNGSVVEDTQLGKIIQLQGDQRRNVSEFLIKTKISKKEHIKLHGKDLWRTGRAWEIITAVWGYASAAWWVPWWCMHAHCCVYCSPTISRSLLLLPTRFLSLRLEPGRLSKTALDTAPSRALRGSTHILGCSLQVLASPCGAGSKSPSAAQLHARITCFESGSS